LPDKFKAEAVLMFSIEKQLQASKQLSFFGQA
jgi:hypothetical protein